MDAVEDTVTFDLAETGGVRPLNAELHRPTATSYEVLHPQGAHSIAAGVPPSKATALLV